ncbi:SDR family NAD(P)-dependent oxidoreductase [Streptomyces sp. AA1529]|uniref:SDR family NAD(P)-dependent oxidoreductase n=1 Tax=Streptomyces sp. AA1529 TaxID=1203257 RepID=UPI003D703C2D
MSTPTTATTPTAAATEQGRRPAEHAQRLHAAARNVLAGADPGAGLAAQRGTDALTLLARRMLAGALRRMGAFTAPGEGGTPDELAAALGVVDQHRRLFEALLDILVTAGTLGREGERLVAAYPLRELSRAESDAMVAGLVAEFPSAEPTVRLLRRCLDAYPEVLTGRRPAAEVLFPDGAGAEPPGAAPGGAPDSGDVVAAVAAEAARARLETATAASVVELGSGSGATAARTLPALAPFGDRLRYACTDPSSRFTEYGRQRFGHQYGFADFTVHDIAVAAATPELPAGEADVLLAANVLHAAADPDAALANAAALLRPGGALVLTEAVSAPEPSVMLFGLTAEWWPQPGAARARLPHAPLLSADAWRAALAAAGFEEIRVHPLPPGADEDDAPEAVLVALRGAPAATTAAPSVPPAAVAAPASAAAPAASPAPAPAPAPAQASPAQASPAPAPPAAEARPAADAGPAAPDAAEPVAIVGLSVRFPGAPDLRSYWDLVTANRSAIGEIPARRWDWRQYYTPDPQGMEVISKSHSRWGGFLEDFDQFDAEFFGMSEQEARNTDPQQRIFLQECWKAMEDAGYCPHALDAKVRRATGVFAGASKLGFDRLGPDRGVDLPRTSFGDMVNRVSYQLDLGGPSKPVDTACSSALVALHEAVQSLRSGECAMALVGGVNLYLHPSTYAELGAVKMLSNRPECPAFGIGGNGIVPGEGVGVVVLKRLADARRDNDHVRAVVRGSAVNHNGRTVGFTSPSPKRQADVITAALTRAGVDGGTVSYLETTVNGTEIGDAVEMTAVTQAFGGREGATGRFRLGSVKPNIGHGEASSGMAQLSKVVLALTERTLPPTRLPQEINPAIDRDKLPFELSDQPVPWDPPQVHGRTQVRRAGITGIGAGGANAHIVVEEAPEAEVRRSAGPALFVLSARTPQQLADSAGNWIGFLRGNPDLDLARVAWTSQVGREPMRFRLAVVAEEQAELCAALERWRAGDTAAVLTGEAKRPASAVRAERAKGRPLPELARVWAEGGMLAWSSLYPQGTPLRLGGLPTYPFATTGYWTDPPAVAPPAAAPAASPAPAPAAPPAPAARPTAAPPAPAPAASRPPSPSRPQSPPPVPAGAGAATRTPSPSPSPSPAPVGAATSAPAAAQGDAARHPLLDLAGAVTGADGTLTVTGSVSQAAQPWLGDHLVNGRVLLAGTALVDMVGRAGETVDTARITELTLHAPLDLTGGQEIAVRLVLAPPAADGTRTVEVTSRPAGAAANRPWSRHAGGTLAPLRGTPDFDLVQWPPPGAEPLPVADYYAAMDAAGYTYGPAFQSLRAVWARGTEVFAEVELPAPEAAEAGRFGVHPALLDSALHAMGFGTWMEGGGGLLPFAWTGMSVHSPGAGGRARARLTGVDGSGVALQLADGDGKPVAQLDCLVLRSATGERPDPARDALLNLAWEPLPCAAAPAAGGPSTGTWSLLGPDPYGIGQVVRTAERGEFAVLSLQGPGDLPVTGEALVPAAHEATGALLDTVRDWLTDPANRGRRLVVLTRGAIAVEPGEPVPDLANAPAWGLLRAAQSEFQRRLVLVDLDRHAPVADVPAAIETALAADEFHLAVRGGRVLVPRLVRAADDPGLEVPRTPAWRLDSTAPGTLENLALVPAPDAVRPLAAGQVRVAVRAAALNFRDVLGALGMYPGDLVLGAEGAGVVTEVGPGVTALAVGDRVFGLLPGGIGPVCVTDARTVRRIPAGWTWAEAASAPVAYLTAYYGLVELAGLRAGESVLVHAAAGGVGSAAVRLADHLGADVFATAAPAKHAEVRAMGVPASLIRSSRDTGYAAAFAAESSNRGVDVVLNSLTGEHIDASLRLLPRGGRFVEMGKTDIRPAGEVEGSHPGVRYQAFDLVEAGPERIGAMFDALLPLFERGVLPPPTRTVLDVRRARDAMRTMSRGRHIGRIVLTIPRTFAPGGTVLVAGGTGTLGSVIARNLVTAHGVRHLVLASRRGDAAPGARELAAELTALGAEVRLARCDATVRDQVAEVLAGIPAGHPLTGVVQAVGALDDGMLAGQTRARLAPVLRAKLDAAVVLDELTRAADPDVFVTFSGAAGVLGNPGQSNYAAANAFLDALARRRRTDGLPGLSVAFGLWASVSDLTRDLLEDERATAMMVRSGFRMLSDQEGAALFDAAVAGPAELAVPMRLDLAALRAAPVHPVLRSLVRRDTAAPAAGPGAPPAGTATPGTDETDRTDGTDRAAGTAPPPSAADPASGTGPAAGVPAADTGAGSSPAAASGTGAPGTLLEQLAGAAPDGRRALLLALVAQEVAAVLPGFEPEHIEADSGFAELGFDSLTAVELRNRLDQATGLRLPVTLVFDQATAGALAGHLLGLLADRIPATAAAPHSARGEAEAGGDSWTALLAPEDLAAVGAIADLGGGGGEQLAALAAQQGTAVLHSVPASPDDALPGTYDLVVALGRLVTVRRKRDLFARIDAALIDGGRMLLADHVGTLRGDLDDRAAGVLVPSVDSWVALLGSARLVVERVTAPPAVLDPLLEQDGLAEPSRRGWTRPALLRLRKAAATAAEDRDRANHRALTEWAGA